MRVYKEKIIKNDSHRRTQRPYKFEKMQHSTWIVKTNQFNSKQIIQILQTVVIDYFFDGGIRDLFSIKNGQIIPGN